MNQIYKKFRLKLQYIVIGALFAPLMVHAGAVEDLRISIESLLDQINSIQLTLSNGTDSGLAQVMPTAKIVAEPTPDFHIPPNAGDLEARDAKIRDGLVTATVCNNDDLTVSSFPVEVILNGILYEIEAVEAYGAFACHSYDIPFKKFKLDYSEGTFYSLAVQVDPFQVIPESNEYNNLKKDLVEGEKEPLEITSPRSKQIMGATNVIRWNNDLHELGSHTAYLLKGSCKQADLEKLIRQGVDGACNMVGAIADKDGGGKASIYWERVFPYGGGEAVYPKRGAYYIGIKENLYSAETAISKRFRITGSSGADLAVENINIEHTGSYNSVGSELVNVNINIRNLGNTRSGGYGYFLSIGDDFITRQQTAVGLRRDEELVITHSTYLPRGYYDASFVLDPEGSNARSDNNSKKTYINVRGTEILFPRDYSEFRDGEFIFIEWLTQLNGQAVDIYLRAPDRCAIGDPVCIQQIATIAKNVPGLEFALGRYEWEIARLVNSPTDEYIVRICNAGSVSCAESNVPFRILDKLVDADVRFSKNFNQPEATLAVPRAVVPFTNFMIDINESVGGASALVDEFVIDVHGLGGKEAYDEVIVYAPNGGDLATIHPGEIVALGNFVTDNRAVARRRLDLGASFVNVTNLVAAGVMKDSFGDNLNGAQNSLQVEKAIVTNSFGDALTQSGLPIQGVAHTVSNRLNIGQVEMLPSPPSGVVVLRNNGLVGENVLLDSIIALNTGSEVEHVETGNIYPCYAKAATVFYCTLGSLKLVPGEINTFKFKNTEAVIADYRDINIVGETFGYRTFVGGSDDQNRAPTINGFTGLPLNIQVGQQIDMSWAATDPDNDDLHWSFEPGDGPGFGSSCPQDNPQNGEGQSFGVTHIWQNPGTFTVTTRVSDCNGGSDEHSFFVKVSGVGGNKPPLITEFSGMPGSIPVGKEAWFAWAAKDQDNDNIYWSFDWGDGSGQETLCPVVNPKNGEGRWRSASHMWSSAGNYEVVVRAFDCNGGDDELRFVVSVNYNDVNLPPVISGVPSGPFEFNVDQSVSLTWNAKDPENDAIAWSVDWGDGEGFTETCTIDSLPLSSISEPTLRATHAWSKPGIYEVTVSVNDCNGGAHSQRLRVSIGGLSEASRILSPEVKVVWPEETEQKIRWVASEADIADHPFVDIILRVVSDGCDPGGCGLVPQTRTFASALHGLRVAQIGPSPIPPPRPIDYVYIAQSIPLADRELNWYIPRGILNRINAQGDFVEIAIIPASKPLPVDFFILSPNFSIIPSQGRVTVERPVGGEDWLIGTTELIRWTSNVPSGTKINIYLDTFIPPPPPCVRTTCPPIAVGPSYLIASGITNDEIFGWNVGYDVDGQEIPKGQYYIVVETDLTGYSDRSDGPIRIFNIAVRSPNGGERWFDGSNKLISWSSANNSNVDIYLKGPNVCLDTPSGQGRSVESVCLPNQALLAQNYTSPILPNSFAWTVDGSLVTSPNGEYVIKICEAGTNICGQSYLPFTIANNVTQFYSPSNLTVERTDRGTLGDANLLEWVNNDTYSTIEGEVNFNTFDGESSISTLRVAGSFTSFIHDGAIQDGRYTYRIKGISVDGRESDWSNPASIVVGSPPPPPPPPPPVQLNAFIQGYKVNEANRSELHPDLNDLQVSLIPLGINSTAQPYGLSGGIVTNTNYTVSIEKPNGWSAGYTLCYNRTNCHSAQPTQGSQVTINIPNGTSGLRYADLWWHFKPITLPTTACSDGVDNDGDGLIDDQDQECHSDLLVNRGSGSYDPTINDERDRLFPSGVDLIFPPEGYVYSDPLTKNDRLIAVAAKDGSIEKTLQLTGRWETDRGHSGALELGFGLIGYIVLEPGVNRLTTYAIDTAGNETASQTHTLTYNASSPISINSSPPEIVFVLPTNQTVKADTDKLVLSAMVSDNKNDAQVSSARWMNLTTGESGALVKGYGWSGVVSLTQGENAIAYRIEDGDGNVATKAITITRGSQGLAGGVQRTTSVIASPLFAIGNIYSQITANIFGL